MIQIETIDHSLYTVEVRRTAVVCSWVHPSHHLSPAWRLKADPADGDLDCFRPNKSIKTQNRITLCLLQRL